jgi:hypothetical protein
MITADDTVKVIDMGVAKVDDAGAVSQTRTGIFVGKLRYAAPEQLGFIPDGEKLDGRADIYAMAMVLFELLTGRPPYEAKSPHEYFLLHARPEVEKPVIALPPTMVGAAALKEVLEKALARDRNHRYATARDFSSALEVVELRLPTEIDEPTSGMTPGTDSTMRLARDVTAASTSITTAQKTMPGTPPPNSAPTLMTPVPQQQLQPTQQAVFPQHQPKQGSVMPLIIIGLLLFGIAAAVAGVMFWPFGGKDAEIADTTTTTPPVQTSTATTTQQGQVAEASVTVTSGTGELLTSTMPPATTTVVEQTQTMPPVGTTREEPREIAPRRTETVAEVTPPVQKPEPAGDDDDDDTARRGLASAPRYVDGGDEGENDRAVANLRRELRGTKSISLRGGAMRDELYRAMRDHLPDMEFDGEADVIVRFEGTMERRGRLGLKRRAAQATVTKNGRVVFRYELPGEDYRTGDSAAEAFARVIANAIE